MFRKANYKYILLLFMSLSILLGGCDLFERNKIDASLLPGHWQTGTLHERYNANGTGYTWDTADDISEAEAQPFNWSLAGNTLTQNHKMEMGGIIPKTYTVTKLNATTLIYQDNYGKTYTFTKQ